MSIFPMTHPYRCMDRKREGHLLSEHFMEEWPGMTQLGVHPFYLG